MKPFNSLYLIALLQLLVTSPALAKDWEAGISLDSISSGTLVLKSSHTMTEFAQTFFARYKLKYKFKFLGKDHHFMVGGHMSNGEVSYTTSVVSRQGYHFKLGIDALIRSQWNKNYQSTIGLSIHPLTSINVFSRVTSLTNDETVTSTNHTKLSGWGWALPIDGMRKFEVRLLGSKLALAAGPQIKLNFESYSTRTDQTVQINQSTKEVVNVSSSSSGSFSSNYLSFGIIFLALF
ncbi:hypothetical protein [Pseudobacteriovorax antillogorgiicola]|uniref:Outer membrane protein beta-barrel domain-containing protein n=1 Tax=Pseudobacteriovorax antillogorgiicola TaxID=1513793 RepID=A0A1Y6CA43_9BACT|nr:hypothetical protein [Pseudobacteriovorax antillogorgiicola]TCS49039.1 hypothetical protein EDD56_11682 [Pseudobacteriovorax antillogorgiicola]SMF52666.1 hypothetical protein SAMN06296036_11672 [Pseudobacteriovorax antillogorgiicola]